MTALTEAAELGLILVMAISSNNTFSTYLLLVMLRDVHCAVSNDALYLGVCCFQKIT